LGRYEEEIDCLDRILADVPGPITVPFRIEKGEALANLDRYQEALECYRAALLLNPKMYSHIFRQVAVALLHLDRIDEAIHIYDAAIRQNTQNRSNLLLVEKGDLLTRVGRFTNAIECFDHALALTPSLPGAWSGKGDALNELGRNEEAMTCYEQAIGIWCGNWSDWHSTSPLALLNLGSLYERAGRNQEAIARYDRSLGILLTRRRTHQALSAYRQVEIIDSKLPELWVRLGVVLERLQQQDKSCACYKHAQSLNPKVSINVQKELDYLGSLVPSSQAPAVQGLPAEGVAAMNRLFDRMRKGEYVQLELGKWKSIVKINPLNLEGLVHIAELLGQLKRSEEQLEYADRALATDEKCVGALNSKGWAYLDLKRYPEAISCFDRLLEIDANSFTTWYSKGVALSKSGCHHEAVSCYDRCLAIDDKSLPSWSNKGGALYNLGRYDEALSCFERALALNRNEGIPG
jgi:tetratricopeptide (TPR) repeat protein